jgi:microcin C transport system substrate-binding protein
MTVDVIPQSLSPGNEQRDFFTCEKARQNGSQNVAGFCDPVLDELVELVIAAPNRAALVARTRALDRVLLHNDFVVPQWHIRSFQIAWWDKFGRPPRPPRFGLGLEAWWVDADRERALAEARRSG